MKSFQRGPSITECRASLFTTRCVACSGRFLVRVTIDTHFVSVCQQHYYQSALLRSSVLLNACDDNLLWHVVSRSSSPVAKPTKTGARGYKCGCSRCCIHDRYVFPSLIYTLRIAHSCTRSAATYAARSRAIHATPQLLLSTSGDP